MLDEEQLVILDSLNATWPDDLKVTVQGGRISGVGKHPLRFELSSFEKAETISLPFFSGNDIRWFTAATNAQGLRTAIENLRCWILPSFGWEESDQPIVTQENARGRLGSAIVSLFPAGYFRWRTAKSSFQLVAEKLRTMRRLEAAKPVHVFERIPSLLELRQQFDLALLTGNRDAAWEAIEAVDHHQLDTAANTLFMRIRAWDEFREYQAIVNNPTILQLAGFRIPQRIRVSLLRAFHAVFLERFETENDFAGAIQAYTEKIHPVLAWLIPSMHPDHGLEARRCLAYLAVHERDTNLARQLLESGGDNFVSELLRWANLVPGDESAPDPAETFLKALQQEDWKTLQESGSLLLQANLERCPPLVRDILIPVLIKSLNRLPNAGLADLLHAHSPGSFERKDLIPQDWQTVLSFIAERRWTGIRRFLDSDNRPALNNLAHADSLRLLTSLEEMFTDPHLLDSTDEIEVRDGVLRAFLDDFVRQEDFPSEQLTTIYLALFQLWSDYKKGSTKVQNGQLLLVLAHAVLLHQEDPGGEIAQGIRSWWNARKVRALVPFAIEALELLSHYTSDLAGCESLWVDVADVMRRNPEEYTQGERSILIQIGRRIGLDDATVAQFFGLTEAEGKEIEDVLARVDLKRIAIVSLQEKAASLAAKLIKDRAKVEVILVHEKDAGTQTRNAKTADVILFVWSACKHAVYRAFDDVREKLVYVQGVGASSIMLALERWVTMRQAETGSKLI